MTKITNKILKKNGFKRDKYFIWRREIINLADTGDNVFILFANIQYNNYDVNQGCGVKTVEEINDLLLILKLPNLILNI
jgi:hypothetical protein